MTEIDASIAQAVDLLQPMSTEGKAIIWGHLNRRNWPDGLPGKPTSMYYEPTGWRLMQWIVSQIGMEACLREWNRERMTESQFSEWWKRHGREYR